MPGPKPVQSHVSDFASHVLPKQFAAQILSGGRRHLTPVSGPLTPAQQAQQKAIEEALRKAMEAFGFHPSDGKSTPHPSPLMDSLIVNTGPVGFDGPPVGGSSNISLFPNGAYNFSGHFHDSGFPSYDLDFVWLVVSSKGTAFLFEHKGRLHGTTESGSRDDNWGESGTNGAIAAAWRDLSEHYSWQWEASVNADLSQLVDAASKAVGGVTKIVSIVASA